MCHYSLVLTLKEFLQDKYQFPGVYWHKVSSNLILKSYDHHPDQSESSKLLNPERKY